ncbi:hypothetical protein KW803_00840 [Candidatus Saccharibacteria bacterium]|nr:hypothetical protein [Candidatus Saccharibacteria bacterium]
MLDIRFIRENADLVQRKSEEKGYKVDINHLLELDNQVRELSPRVEELRRQRRELEAQRRANPKRPSHKRRTWPAIGRARL